MNAGVIHQNTQGERWFSLSLVEQLANVGSEVSRSLSARARGKEERARSAAFRALELFDFTIEDPKNRYRLKEILRARELFCDFFFGENTLASSTSDQWQSYFIHFAIAANAGK